MDLFPRKPRCTNRCKSLQHPVFPGGNVIPTPGPRSASGSAWRSTKSKSCRAMPDLGWWWHRWPPYVTNGSWDGEFTWPELKGCWWPTQPREKVRSCIESPGWLNFWKFLLDLPSLSSILLMVQKSGGSAVEVGRLKSHDLQGSIYASRGCLQPENRPKPNRKRSCSNHLFLGGFSLSSKEGN